MLRRLHTPVLRVGDLPLDAAQARHAREVLRLSDGQTVEVFDDRGAVARAQLIFTGPRDAIVRVGEINETAAGMGWAVASAVPKGERADWMIEKLSELGAQAFIPLAAARSVVVPEGKNKLERWRRIATESAKQSRRSGVMRIESPVALVDLLRGVTNSKAGICLSTEVGAEPVMSVLQQLSPGQELILFIGPEGGWTEEELLEFKAAGIRFAQLTATVLRVETAAIAAAAIVSTFRTQQQSGST